MSTEYDTVGPPPFTRDPLRRVLKPVTRPVKRAWWWFAVERDARLARFRSADLAVFHEFVPPPAGGAHQMLRAILAEMARRGVRIELHKISATTRACLFNSFNFDFGRLERLARSRPADCRMVHRVDGPIGVYRGFDDGTDARVAAVNRLADATVFQSRYSLEKHRELGYELAEPHAIPNAVDPAIFHPRGRVPFERGRRIRLISSSWSDNPRKGGPTYGWLEDNLDWSRFEYTFVGRTKERFRRARGLPPVPSGELAELLRAHDVFVAASEDDPCSNAVLEALACGLPVLYRDSGGHPELVGEAGLPFREREELPALLDRLVEEYEERQAAIRTPAVTGVAEAYLAVLGLDGD